MDTFLPALAQVQVSIHQDEIVGTLSMFDRMIFKDYLTGFFPKALLLPISPGKGSGSRTLGITSSNPRKR